MAFCRHAAMGLLFLAACASTRVDPWAVLPTRPYVAESGLIQALARYRAGQAGLRSLSGRARGTATEGRKSRPFKQVFAVQLPDLLRIEIQTSVGQTLAVFACDGTSVYYKDRDLHLPSIEPASPAAVERSLGYPLSAGELVDALLGRLPPLQLVPEQMLQRAGDIVFLVDPGVAGRVEYGFDLRGGVLRSKTYFGADGGRKVGVRYLEFTAVESQIVPARIELANLETRQAAQWSLARASLNPSLRPEVFAPGP